MNKLKLSRAVFLIVISLLVISFIIFFFNPGLILKFMGVYSLYYIIPILVFLLIVDYSFNSKYEKKYLLYGIISLVILLTLSFVLRYWINVSFNLFL